MTHSGNIIKPILASYSKKIISILDRFLSEYKLPAGLKVDKHFFEILKDFYTRGGKKLRPYLVYLGYRLCHGKRVEDIHKIAASVELIHTFMLIHDDIMDKSKLRRGGDTVHVWYEKKSRELYNNKKMDRKHFGESMAILAGDLCIPLACALIHETGFSLQHKLQCIKMLHNTIYTTILGQALDIHLEARGSATEKELLTLYKYKTAYYTFVMPLQIGMMLAGASKEVQKAIEKFAIPAGIMFQLCDDIMDNGALIVGKQEIRKYSVRAKRALAFFRKSVYNQEVIGQLEDVVDEVDITNVK